MRFHYGAVPEGPALPPGDWRAMREPGPWPLLAIALPLGLAAGAGVFWWLWRMVQLHHLGGVGDV